MTALGTELDVYRSADVDSWVDVMGPVVKLAQHVADTDFVPRPIRGNAPAVAAVILHGRELGLGPMTSLSVMHFVDGRPTLSAESQRGLVQRAGHEIELVESTGAMCTWRGRRSTEEKWTAVTWTLDAARHAGLLSKPSWKSYPRDMLSARASATLCRAIFADVLHGMRATEEADEPAGTDTAPQAPRRTVRRAPAPTAAIDPPEPERPSNGHVAPPAPVDVELPEPPEPETVELEPGAVSPAQLKMLGATWSRFAVTDDERRDLTSQLVGRDLAGTTKNLTKPEAHYLITNLTRIIRDLADPDVDPMSEEVDPVDARAHLEQWLHDVKTERETP